MAILLAITFVSAIVADYGLHEKRQEQQLFLYRESKKRRTETDEDALCEYFYKQWNTFLDFVELK